MRKNRDLINYNLIKHNFYKKDWKYIDNSVNTVNYYLKKHNIIIKIYKLIDSEKKITDTNNFLNLNILEYSKFGYCNSFRELFLLELMYKLIESNVCIHYPILITYKKIKEPCKICNKLIQNKINNNPKVSQKYQKYLQLQLQSTTQLYIFKEYIEYEFYTIFNKKHNNTFWLVLLFQILFILYNNNRHLELINFDIHLDNIFYYKIKSGGYLYYTVNNIKYKIPNIGYIFIITDYGNSLSLKFKLTSSEKKQYNLLYNIHYDVYSFFNNFTIPKLKMYHLNWFYNDIIITRMKSEYPEIYKQTNEKYKNKYLKQKLQKIILKNNEIFKKFHSNLFLPSKSFLQIISKYTKYIKLNVRKKKLQKLNPINIIKNEFQQFQIM